MSTIIIQGRFQLNQPESCASWPFQLRKQVLLVSPLPDYFHEENITTWKGSHHHEAEMHTRERQFKNK